MTSCKFCLGLVDVKAKKCKHCGEWLQEKQDFFSKAKKTLNDGVTFLKEKNDGFIQNRSSHIYIPSDEKPLKIKNHEFFSNHFTFKNKKIPYDRVRSIFFNQSSMSTNGLVSNTTTDFDILVDNSEDIQLDLDMSSLEKHQFLILTGLFQSDSKKEKEIVQFLHKYISKITFRKRLSIVIYSLNKRGYFSYPGGVKIYSNGDIILNEKKRNIFEAKDNDLLVYGNHRLSGRNSIFDPFKFCIYDSNGFKIAIAGFEFSKKLEFQVYFDKDVFDGVLNYAIKQKSFSLNL